MTDDPVTDRVERAQGLAEQARAHLSERGHAAGCSCRLCEAARLTQQAAQLLEAELAEAMLAEVDDG